MYKIVQNVAIVQNLYNSSLFITKISFLPYCNKIKFGMDIVQHSRRYIAIIKKFIILADG